MTNKEYEKNNKSLIRCRDCKNLLNENDFYKKKNGDRIESCKQCITKDIINKDKSTFEPILKEMDFPYIPNEWEDCIIRQKEKDPSKITGGQNVFGIYLVNMRRALYKPFNYETSQEACELYENTPHNIGKRKETEEEKLIKSPDATFISESDLNLENELTKEDIQYLLTKWGDKYTANEWVQLEKMYVGMKESFPIEDAAREKDLTFLCKIVLKANQAIDAGDIKTFTSFMKVYKDLMTTGKFTAAQNKDNGDNQINSASELVLICERQKGFIPKFCTDVPQDKVDATIKDFEDFLENLVMKDLGFGKSFENALKKLEKEKLEKEKTLKESVDEDDDEDLELKARNIYVELQKRIEEEASLLDEPENDDFLNDFMKEDGDNIPFLGEDFDDGGDE